MKITALDARDVRFPTSRQQDGSDAMNVGDYSAVYVTLETDGPLAGYGLTFTNGHGTEIGVAAARAFRRLLVGLSLEEITADFRGLYQRLTQDPQLRWIGPERGVVHMALGAVVNALWDLWARRERKPLWKLLADLTPRQTVACVPFLWITDALTPDEALAILERNAAGRPQREAAMRRDGFPAYTTSTGWLGYPDEKVRRLCREAVAQGWTHFKMKVGPRPRGQPPARRPDARRDRLRAPPQHGREPVLGRARGDRAGEGPLPLRRPGGSRSRPAPTTCSATRRSPGRSPRSRWPPARCARTASSSSS